MRRSRLGQWLIALGVIGLCVAGIALYTGFLRVSQDPPLQVLPRGQAWQGEGASLSVLKLETLTKIPNSSLSRGPGIGGIFIAVTMQAEVRDPEGDLVCGGELLATDGRTWSVSLDQLLDGERCPLEPTTGPVTFVRLYAVPAKDTDKIAGIVMRSYLTQDRVLVRPPA